MKLEKPQYYNHLKYIRAKKLWKEYGKGEGIHCVVLDTDYGGEHNGWFHYTGVMEIIKRVAPKAKTTFISWTEGNKIKFVEGCAKLLELHKTEPVHVVNMSVALVSSPAYYNMIKKIYDLGIIIVASSGNNSQSSQKVAPACYDKEVISVGSLYHGTGRISGFTQEPYDLLAPGEWFGKDLKVMGTSYAAPHIAGMACCMLSKSPMIHSTLIESELTTWLKDMARPTNKNIEEE